MWARNLVSYTKEKIKIDGFENEILRRYLNLRNRKLQEPGQNYTLKSFDLKMEAVNTSETSVGMYRTTWRNIQESRLQTRRRENLKSHHLA
jgi:predicted phage-related endonuclease